MERTRFIEHHGHRLLLLDYSGIRDVDEALPLIERSKEIVARQRPDSLLTLTDVTGARYNSEILQGLKELVAHDEPYVKSAAVVVDSAIQRAAVRIVIHFTGRSLKVFEHRDAAKDWLVTQA